MSEACHCFWTPWEESILLPSPAAGSHLNSLTYGPLLLSKASIRFCKSLCLWPSCLPLIGTYTGPPRLSRLIPPTSSSLILSICKVLLPIYVRWYIQRFQELACGNLWETIMLLLSQCIFNFLRSCQLFFIVCTPFYIPTSSIWELLILTNTWYGQSV